MPPPSSPGGGGGKRRVERAVEEARKFDRNLSTVWTDGSRLDRGGVGGAVAWYEEIPHHGLPPSPLLFDRRGALGVGSRVDRTAHTYRDRQRPFRETRSGWRSVGFGMSPGHEAHDSELTAVALGLRLLAQRGGGAGLHSLHRLPGGDEESGQRRPRAGRGESSGGPQTCSAAEGSGQYHHHPVGPVSQGAEGNEQADQRDREVAALPFPEIPPRFSEAQGSRAGHLEVAGGHREEKRWQEDL